MAVWLGVLLLSASAPAQDRLPKRMGAGSVSLQGRVVNALTGEPVPQVTVSITIPRMGPMAGYPYTDVTAVSDTSGNFKFETLPPGSYALVAGKPGFLSYGYDSDAIRPVTGRAGDEITGLEIRLTPPAFISGRALDAFGEPMRNVRVRLLQQSDYFHQTRLASSEGRAIAEARTDALGEFLIGGLKPGKYIILADSGKRVATRVAGQAVEGYVNTYYPNAGSLSAAEVVPVAAGQHLSGMDIWVRKEAVFRVSGKVVGVEGMRSDVAPWGRPGTLTLEARDGRPLSREWLGATTNREGQFEINSVPAGSYYLRATHGLAPINMRVPVNVVDADVTGLTILAAPVTEITGRVRMEGDGKLPPNAIIRVRPVEDSRYLTWSGRVQKDGTFTIEQVLPGKHLIYLSPGSRTYTKQVLAGGADVLRTGLDLAEPQAAPVLEVVLSPKVAMIEGVALRDGKTFPNGYVTLVPEPMRPESRFFMSSTRTDRNGRFTMKGLTPGDYKLYGWEESVELVNVPPQDLQPYDAGSVSVRLAEGDTKQVEVQVASPR